MIKTEAHLDACLSDPTDAVVAAMAALEGDLLILGVGGKMGPTLAMLAKRASDKAGTPKQVIGVSRFSEPTVREKLHRAGVQTITADLLAEDALQSLPDTRNVVLMAGRKFGATGNESLTWAMNSYLPGRVAERFRNSQLNVFSTGNVYPMTPIAQGGATEQTPTDPIGEYAQSCLSRERICAYFSSRHGTPMTILRLNYAIDLRYGILLDVAERVHTGTPVPLEMGNVNVIWQGDANAVALRAFAHCETPPAVLNVTGPETVSIRYLASRFAELFNTAPRFTGQESTTALLSNAARCHRWFGYPQVSLEQMIHWVADWVQRGGTTYRKPTHFEVRDGKF